MTYTGKTNLDVCKDALVMIRGEDINNIDTPNTPTEYICSRLYSLVANSILSRYEWSCASAPRQCAVSGDVTPVGNYKYAYKLPSDMIAGPTAVYDSKDAKYPFHDYVLSGDYIHTDAEIIYVKYNLSASVSIWPAYLYNLIVTALAGKLAFPVADNETLGNNLLIEAFGTPSLDGTGGLFAEAKRLDSANKPIRTMHANGDPLTATRR